MNSPCRYRQTLARPFASVEAAPAAPSVFFRPYERAEGAAFLSNAAEPNSSLGIAAQAEPSISLLPEREGSAASFPLHVQLSEPALVLLAVIAAHDRVSPAEVLTRAICARAEAIGLPSLLQGREEASHLVHTQEVGRSNRPPATSTTPESGVGREGVPCGALPVPTGPP